jgi:hypothetical protein
MRADHDMRRRVVIHRPDMAEPLETATEVRREPLKEPTLVELATNFTGAMARWAAAGVPVLDQEGYDARAAACGACVHPDGRPMFDAKARFGLGKCRAPGCGCTSLKRWLATEVCVLGRWP